VKLLLCLLRGGHVEGGPVVFTYARLDRSVSQHPGRRGETVIKILGTECKRCGRLIPSSAAERIQAAREMVDGLIGTRGEG
jgi:hypothetical protein